MKTFANIIIKPKLNFSIAKTHLKIPYRQQAGPGKIKNLLCSIMTKIISINPYVDTDTISTSQQGPEFTTKAKFNLTSNPPKGKKTLFVDSTNSSGQQKDQFAVEQVSPPPDVAPNDFSVHAKPTQYVQDPSHHGILSK